MCTSRFVWQWFVWHGFVTLIYMHFVRYWFMCMFWFVWHRFVCIGRFVWHRSAFTVEFVWTLVCTDWFVWTLICVHCLVCVDTCLCALSGFCGHTFVCRLSFQPLCLPPSLPPSLHSLPPPHQILTEQTFHWPYSHRNSGGDSTSLAQGFLQPAAGTSRLNTFDQAITLCTIILFFACGGNNRASQSISKDPSYWPKK